MEFGREIPVCYPDGVENPPVCDSSAVMAIYDIRGTAADFMRSSTRERRGGLASSKNKGNSHRLHLYKYRNFDWQDKKNLDKNLSKIRGLLVQNRVWSASPQSLNDPQDMLFNVVYTNDPAERRQWLEKHAALLNGMPTEKKNSLLKRFEHMDFTPEMQAAAKREIDSRTGAFCASTNPRNAALWTYYADSHKGFCVQYATYNDALFMVAKKVRYTKDYPTVVVPVDHSNITEYYLYKSPDWAHEDEWRIVFPINSCAVQLNPRAVSGVIFGVNVEPETVEMVLRFQRDRTQLGSPPLKLYQAYLPSSNYGIRIASFR